MLELRPARIEDVEAAVMALADAFSDDPLMRFFFAGGPMGVAAATTEFLSILLRARLALAAPALVAIEDGDLIGAAMGYATVSPDWPTPLVAEWERLEMRVPGLSDRLAAYDQLAEVHRPEAGHYYLGVLGVRRARQGVGAGRALLDAFCALSQADSRSNGVYLETATAENVAFYRRHGFELRGDGELGTAHLWCLFRPS